MNRSTLYVLIRGNLRSFLALDGCFNSTAIHTCGIRNHNNGKNSGIHPSGSLSCSCDLNRLICHDTLHSSHLIYPLPVVKVQFAITHLCRLDVPAAGRDDCVIGAINGKNSGSVCWTTKSNFVLPRVIQLILTVALTCQNQKYTSSL